MAEKIRVGMIGAGPWGGRAHLPALALLPEYELKAVATTRQETADAAAQQQAAGMQNSFRNAYGACIEARGYSAKY